MSLEEGTNNYGTHKMIQNGGTMTKRPSFGPELRFVSTEFSEVGKTKTLIINYIQHGMMKR